jgi:hypothetical protein
MIPPPDETRIAEIRQRYSEGRYLWEDRSGRPYDGDADVDYLLEHLATAQAEIAALTAERENVLSSPMAAGLLLKLKQECEAQHARAEALEAQLQRAREALTEIAELRPFIKRAVFDESLARQLQQIARAALAERTP